MQLQATSITEAATQIQTFRRYKPFHYGGKWFIAHLGNELHAFRSVQPIKARLAKLGLASTEIAVLN